MKLGDQTIVLVDQQPTGQHDRYGSDILGPVYTEVQWCLVTPAGSSETGDQSAARISGLQLLAPPGTAVDAADAVIYPFTKTVVGGQPVYDGPRYQVDGDVGVWEDSVQAQLTRAV